MFEVRKFGNPRAHPGPCLEGILTTQSFKRITLTELILMENLLYIKLFYKANL